MRENGRQHWNLILRRMACELLGDRLEDELGVHGEDGAGPPRGSPAKHRDNAAHEDPEDANRKAAEAMGVSLCLCGLLISFAS